MFLMEVDTLGAGDSSPAGAAFFGFMGVAVALSAASKLSTYTF